MEFGQSVNSLLDQVRMRVRGLIPGFIGARIFEPEVRAQVDDAFAGFHATRDGTHGFGMGKGEKEHIGTVGQGFGRQGFEGQRHDTL